MIDNFDIQVRTLSEKEVVGSDLEAGTVEVRVILFKRNPYRPHVTTVSGVEILAPGETESVAEEASRMKKDGTISPLQVVTYIAQKIHEDLMTIPGIEDWPSTYEEIMDSATPR